MMHKYFIFKKSHTRTFFLFLQSNLFSNFIWITEFLGYLYSFWWHFGGGMPTEFWFGTTVAKAVKLEMYWLHLKQDILLLEMVLSIATWNVFQHWFVICYNERTCKCIELLSQWACDWKKLCFEQHRADHVSFKNCVAIVFTPSTDRKSL